MRVQFQMGRDRRVVASVVLKGRRIIGFPDRSWTRGGFRPPLPGEVWEVRVVRATRTYCFLAPIARIID